MQNVKRKTYGVGTSFASPWSPPTWMKETAPGHDISPDHPENGGRLQPQHYYGYGDYLAKYVNYMAQNGVNLSALSVQNEPDNSGPGGETCFLESREYA